MDGNLFRGSKSTSPIDEAPPRDSVSIKRYAQHLPFQVFCCESGTHIVDPAQSYYSGISYRSSIEHGIFNISAAEDGKAPKWSEGPCMDSAQMHFCRDLWMLSAREGVKIDAKKARDRERKGLPRGLNDEMEKIVKQVAPQFAPQEKSSGGMGGMFGFGRKKPAAEPKPVVDEDDEDEWDEEDGDEGAESAAQAEEKKEQAMAADAAAAALPVEEQHPNAGSDTADNADGQAIAADPAAKKDDQFVDPEAMLELEAERAAAAAQANAKRDANALAPETETEAEPKKQKKAKRAAKKLNERADAPAAADPAANVAPKAGIKRPPSVNNPDESDKLDSAAPAAPNLSGGSRQSAGGSGASGRNRALKNAAFAPARILVNPRCVTTYAGVSHTQLALDLFGDDDDEESVDSKRDERGAFDDDDDGAGSGAGIKGPAGSLGGSSRNRKQSFSDKYVMHAFGPAAETFVCQEMRTSGGRSAPKQQRRTGFSIARGLVEGWQPR